MEAYRFHGEKYAPRTEDIDGLKVTQAFWNQSSDKHNVQFRINRAHPLVEALVQTVPSKKFADAFLCAFERLLPISSILQHPAKSIHGLAMRPSDLEINQMFVALKLTINILHKSGFALGDAIESALSCQPFSDLEEHLRPLVAK